MKERSRFRSTTVICVRRNGQVVMAADGQVTFGDHVLKHSAKKIRRLYQDRILAGFAGSTADAFALFKRFEAKLEQFSGNPKAATAQLHKGLALIASNKRQAGVEELRSLVHRHPQTPEAQMAREKLNGLGVRINPTTR